MPDVEVTFEFGRLKFSAKGSEEWVSVQLTRILEVAGKPNPAASVADADRGLEAEPEALEGLGLRASRWLVDAGLSMSDLEPFFHKTDSGFELIASTAPGASDQERVKNTYLLTGIRHLLQSDAPKFEEQEGRENCRRLGCYDKDQHSKQVKRVGNLLLVASDGVTLTGPGLKAAAALIKPAA